MVSSGSRPRIRSRCRRNISSTSTRSRNSSNGRSSSTCSNIISNTRRSRRRCSSNIIRSRSNNSMSTSAYTCICICTCTKRNRRRRRCHLMVCLYPDVYGSDESRSDDEMGTDIDRSICPTVHSCCSVSAARRLWSVSNLAKFFVIASVNLRVMPRRGPSDRLSEQPRHALEADLRAYILQMQENSTPLWCSGVYGNTFEDGCRLQSSPHL